VVLLRIEHLKQRSSRVASAGSKQQPAKAAVKFNALRNRRSSQH
jgi:hypothetical protein